MNFISTGPYYFSHLRIIPTDDNRHWSREFAVRPHYQITDLHLIFPAEVATSIARSFLLFAAVITGTRTHKGMHGKGVSEFDLLKLFLCLVHAYILIYVF